MLNLPNQHRDTVLSWRDKATYSEAIRNSYLRPLTDAVKDSDRAPKTIQRTVLLGLQLYFATDMQERAPTVLVDEPMAVEFHKLLRQIMEYIDVDNISMLEGDKVNPEVMHALLSYKGLNCYSPIALEAYDHDQGLVRLSYYLHGNKPSEQFFIDGKQVEPAFSKYRGCRFFRRMLMRHRIVWLPVKEGEDLDILLDGTPCVISFNQLPLLASRAAQSITSNGVLNQARTTFPRGKGGREPLPFNLRGLKARAMRWLARNSLVRKKFSRAWVFVDRESDADDNAEHLYRWISEHHPEINTWFLLTPDSHDWDRLAKEGFRLMPPGLQRKLLLLNSDNIVSSHAEYMLAGFDLRLYGDLMNWRYAFPQHGVIKDDLSHWLSNQPFDIFVTTSPDEHASIVDDDTPYTYTAREMRRTGLPRHDRLLKYADEVTASEVNVLLIMPTWRGGLVDNRATGTNTSNSIDTFAKSQYVQYWRAVLCSEELRELSLTHAMKVVFMPHPNTVPYIDAFELPPHIEVATFLNADVQRLFAKSVALITDYTSVAFEFALLRRTVFYYQFDRDSFYGGGHNWREGYFNFDRDGFGPVSLDHEDLIQQIGHFLQNNAQTEPQYLTRMEHAMPERDGQSCRRVFESIQAVRKPFNMTLHVE